MGISAAAVEDAITAPLPKENRKRVGLALSGGSARGLGHIGVLEILDREGVPIDCIAGTSAGSLVGAIYAAGIRGQRLTELARQVHWWNVFRPIWPRNGLVSFAPLESFLARLIDDRTFADLDIPFTAVTTDLASGEQVVLHEGRVAPAVRASCSIPGIVSPLDLDGRLLADGGICNNLPISVARAMGADVVIAVTLVTPKYERPTGILGTLAASLEYLLIRAGDDPATADACISLPFAGLSSLIKLWSAEKSIALGRYMAEQALPAIEALLK